VLAAVSVLSCCAGPAVVFAAEPADFAAWDDAMTRHFFDVYVKQTFSAAEIDAMRARGIVDQASFARKATLSEAQRIAAKGAGFSPGQWVFQATAARDGAVAQGVHRQAAKSLSWSKDVTAGKLFKFAGDLAILGSVGQAADAFGETLFGRPTYFHADGSVCEAYGSGVVPCSHPGTEHFMYRPDGWLREGVEEFDLIPGWSAEATVTVTYDFTPNPGLSVLQPQDFNPDLVRSSYEIASSTWNASAASLFTEVMASWHESRPIVGSFGFSYRDTPYCSWGGLVNMVTGASFSWVGSYAWIRVPPNREVPTLEWGVSETVADAAWQWYQDQMAALVDGGSVIVTEVAEEAEVPGVAVGMPPEAQMPRVLSIPGAVHDQLTDPDGSTDAIASDVLEQITVPDTLPDPVEDATGVDENENRWTGKTAPLIGSLRAETANRWPFAGGVVLAGVWEQAQGGTGDPMLWQVDFNPFSGEGVPGIGLFPDPVVMSIDPTVWLSWMSGYRWALVGALAVAAIAALIALLRPRIDV
jgi:hypothetical protein